MSTIPTPLVAIELRSLSKTYTRRQKPAVEAVKTLDLVIPKGEIFGFLGANGAGKTTTIKMICGLIIPTTGQVYVNGIDMLRKRGAAVQHIGAVLEGTRNVYWRLSAWHNLLYFGHLKGCAGKALKVRAEQLLRELDLWERRNDILLTFSRGMQQKVAIACALIADPPIVLLDEPTLGLDVQAALTVKEWVRRLAHEQGKTVLLTTHQLDMAQELCDTVGIMRQGKLITHGPLTELLHLFQRDYYQVRFQGSIPPHLAGQWPALNVTQENGETLLTGPITDQAQLYIYIQQMQTLGLPLLSVNRVEPGLEDVFLQLHSADGKGTQSENRPVSYV